MDTECKYFVGAAEVPDILKRQRARDESVRKPERRNIPSVPIREHFWVSFGYRLWVLGAMRAEIEWLDNLGRRRGRR